ncbi:MAG: geranylgeranyl pyrophosphate synthetase [Bogoriella megaspora]|nr:MAG: geranylgeranyl pyrophosphate synthetase [Bogoriella megaspora]
MHSELLKDRAKTLVVKLTDGCDGNFGRGSMSSAIYDTAWISMISRSGGSSNKWLFPECFTYILEQQCDDGSWASYASQSDGILNTAASLLALLKHANDNEQNRVNPMQSLEARVEKAVSALSLLLNQWDVGSTVHVGFEILIPALLTYLEREGLNFDFPGRSSLYAINAKKLAKFKPEYLYMDMKTTALHSLEAFIGKVDFNRVRHHKVGGAFMASPSSTAAYLMNASEWDDDCETYLRNVVANGAGNGSGGIPSAFPSTIFELTWGLSTLSEADFDLQSIAPSPTRNAVQFLNKVFVEENGLVGFAPNVGADADDTAKAILTLNLLSHPTSPKSLLQEFEEATHFKTYQQERDPSFSANCNVLNSLLHVETPSDYTSQIEKTIKFLCATFQDSNKTVRDKWNLSPFYPFMLMMQASGRLLQLWASGSLPALPESLIVQTLLPILSELSLKTLRSQKQDGSWGDKGFQEETAYAVLVLAYALQIPSLQGLGKDAHYACERGRTFLNVGHKTQRENLWVEKVTYASEVLSEAYILAALNIALPASRHDSPLSITESDVLINDAYTPETNAARAADVKINGTNTGSNYMENSVSLANGTNAIQSRESNGDGPPNKIVDPTTNDSSKGQSDVTDSEAASSPSWSSENERILLGPFDYLEQQPGKDIRTKFILAFNEWLEVPPESLATISKVVKMLHTASLLVDDIEDSSVLRRGVPVAHSIFGIAQTFNSGNYVYFLALEEVRKLRQPEATSVFVQELLNLHRGQGMDLYWRDSLICPTEREYLDMVGNKTGGLFRLAVRLMEVESPHDRNCEKLVDLLGRIFQIRDDYMNLFSIDYAQNKGLCEDLTEGKFSFPIIHSVRSDPENRQLMNILKQKSTEDRIKKYAVSIMEKTGSFSYTRSFVRNLKSQAGELIEKYESQGWGTGNGVRKLLARLDME